MVKSDTMGTLDFPMQLEKNNEKQLKKQKLVRNEFLGNRRDMLGIPLIKKQNINLKDLEAWGYSKTKMDDVENRDKIVHFFHL